MKRSSPWPDVQCLRSPSHSEPTRHVVIWSGGADSTLVLERLARAAMVANPVVAFTIDTHPQIGPLQLRGQHEAQRAYLARAKIANSGIQVRHVCLGIRTKEDVTAPENGQATIWLAALLPYVRDGDAVHFGYIKGDDFWYYRAAFERAFDAFCRSKGVHARIVYDIEWYTKLEVVRELRSYKVPPACIWTCEEPFEHHGRPAQCGTCYKCLAMKAACEQLAAEKRGAPLHKALATNKLTSKMKRDLQKPRKTLGSAKPDPRKPATFRWDTHKIV